MMSSPRPSVSIGKTPSRLTSNQRRHLKQEELSLKPLLILYHGNPKGKETEANLGREREEKMEKVKAREEMRDGAAGMEAHLVGIQTVSFVIGKGSTKWKGPHHQNCGFVNQWIDSTDCT